MNIIALVVMILFLMSFRKRQDRTIVLDRTTTATINGLFVLLVLMRHYSVAFAGGDGMSEIFMRVSRIMGQQIVTPFFFISGYGTMRSIESKGSPYVQSFPTKKILRLLVHFDICVLAYMLLNVALGRSRSLLINILSLLTITNVGNSNWFITVTLMLYAIIWLCFRNRPDIKRALTMMTIAVVIYALIAARIGMPTRYYNTVIAFPVGMWVAMYREELKAMLYDARFIRTCMVVLLPILGILVLARGFKSSGTSFTWLLYLVLYWLATIALIAMILFAASRFEMPSKLFGWFGAHVFEVYMLQRIPMMAFYFTGVLASSVVGKFFIVLAVTVVLSRCMELLLKRIDLTFGW